MNLQARKGPEMSAKFCNSGAGMLIGQKVFGLQVRAAAKRSKDVDEVLQCLSVRKSSGCKSAATHDTALTELILSVAQSLILQIKRISTTSLCQK